MMRIKIGFKDLSIPKQIQKARLIEKKMTGNSYYLNPDPSLATLHQAIDALESAFNKASKGGKKMIDIRTMRQKEMLEIIRQLAAYVQAASHGIEEILLSSGFEVVRKGERVEMGKVEKLRTRSGTTPGSIHAIWNKMKGAYSYLVEISESPIGENSFRLYRVVVQSRLDIIGLVPGKPYWVRITAVGRDGYGLPSDPSIQTTAYTY